MNRLPVDPAEQRMFDDLCETLKVSPLKVVAHQIYLERNMAPVGGSFREMKAIHFNVVMEALAAPHLPQVNAEAE